MHKWFYNCKYYDNNINNCHIDFRARDDNGRTSIYSLIFNIPFWMDRDFYDLGRIRILLRKYFNIKDKPIIIIIELTISFAKNMSIVRSTISCELIHFKGDAYFNKKDLNKLLHKKPEIPIKKTIKTKKKNIKKPPLPSISFKDYILNKFFKLWLNDNINELKETFSVIYNIFIKNNAILGTPYNEMFKNYCQQLFRINKAAILKEYEDYIY